LEGFVEITPQIKAYFEAKDGNVDAIDNYFADDILIEDTGENDIIKGFDNCRKWLKEKSRQYEMKTKIAGITADEKGTIKVSVSVSGNFAIGDYPFDYYFTVTDGKIKTVKIIYTGACSKTRLVSEQASEKAV
jgi:ketosteroid isomerase-like protein